ADTQGQQVQMQSRSTIQARSFRSAWASCICSDDQSEDIPLFGGGVQIQGAHLGATGPYR
ncbi:hypothetical protein NX05_22625, partial [Xanthomonas vasicola]